MIFYLVTDNCAALLGMKDGRIADVQISASSEYYQADRNLYYKAIYARLDRNSGSINGAWTPGSWVSQQQDLDQWVEVNFGVPRKLSGVILQGRQAHTTPYQWVTKYMVTYSDDEGASWKYVKDLVKDVNGEYDEVCTSLNSFQVTKV